MLGKWRETSPKIWRVFYDKDKNCIEVMSDEEGLVQYNFEARRRFKRVPTTSHVEPREKPANAGVASGGKLKLLGVETNNSTSRMITTRHLWSFSNPGEVNGCGMA